MENTNASPAATRCIDVQVQGLVALDDVVADDQQVRRDRGRRTRLDDERAEVRRREPASLNQPGVRAAGRRPGVREAVRIAARFSRRFVEREGQQRHEVGVGLDHLEVAGEARRISVVVLDGDRQHRNHRTVGRAGRSALPLVHVDVQRLRTLDLVIAGDYHVADDDPGQPGRENEQTACRPGQTPPRHRCRSGGAAPVSELEGEAVVRIGGLCERQGQRGRGVPRRSRPP